MSLIPNILTFSRCVFAVLVAFALWKAAGAGQTAEQLTGADEILRARTFQHLWYQFAFFAFASGAFTDFVDGALARLLKAESAFGVWLDPIADKLLVGLALAGLAITFQSVLIALPAGVIIARDIFMTWLRARPEGKAVMAPSQLAKWKTAAEMLAIIAFLLPLAIFPRAPDDANTAASASLLVIGPVLLLWIAAALSAWTCYVYLKAVRAR